MKVLFVCSGNSKDFSITPFIKKQGESLRKRGIEVDYFSIVGKGIAGYFRAALRLRKHLRYKRYDIIHAHFSLSGWTAVLGAGKTPVVLSLMGDDAYGTYVGENKIRFTSRYLMLLTWLIQPFVNAIISKSRNIEKHVYQKHKSYVIPNGIDITEFRQHTANGSAFSRKNLTQTILFLGKKTEPRKNYALVESAVRALRSDNIQLINPYPVKHDEVAVLLNSVDVLAVSSFMEGSPNVIKEALACNCPIVSTDMGDVRWVIGDTAGCYVSSYRVEDFASGLRLALKFAETNGRTNGAERLARLQLDEDSIAQKVIGVYQDVLDRGTTYAGNLSSRHDMALNRNSSTVI